MKNFKKETYLKNYTFQIIRLTGALYYNNMVGGWMQKK